MCCGRVACAPHPLLPAHTAPCSRSPLPTHGCSLTAFPSVCSPPLGCPVALPLPWPCLHCTQRWWVLARRPAVLSLVLAAVPRCAGARAVPPPILLAARRCVWTRRRLMFTLSGAPCSLTRGGHTLGGGGGRLATGLTLVRCGRHHACRTLTCSLILGSRLLCAAGSPVLGRCARSLAAGLGLTSPACSCAGAHPWLTLTSSPIWSWQQQQLPTPPTVGQDQEGWEGKRRKGQAVFCH